MGRNANGGGEAVGTGEKGGEEVGKTTTTRPANYHPPHLTRTTANNNYSQVNFTPKKCKLHAPTATCITLVGPSLSLQCTSA